MNQLFKYSHLNFTRSQVHKYTATTKRNNILTSEYRNCTSSNRHHKGSKQNKKKLPTISRYILKNLFKLKRTNTAITRHKML